MLDAVPDTEVIERGADPPNLKTFHVITSYYYYTIHVLQLQYMYGIVHKLFTIVNPPQIRRGSSRANPGSFRRWSAVLALLASLLLFSLS